MTAPVVPQEAVANSRSFPVSAATGTSTTISWSLPTSNGHSLPTAADRLVGANGGLDSILETLAILDDPDMMQAICDGDAAVAVGDVVQLEDFRRIVAEQRAR